MKLITLNLLALASLATALPRNTPLPENNESTPFENDDGTLSPKSTHIPLLTRSEPLPDNTQSCKATQYGKDEVDGVLAPLWYEVTIGVPYSEAMCKEIVSSVMDKTVGTWYRESRHQCLKTKNGQLKFQFDAGTKNHEYRINYALHQVFPLIGVNCPGS